MSKQKRAPNRRRLTDAYIRSLSVPTGKAVMIWDTLQSGLVLKARPTGTKTFKVAYRHQGRLRWYTIDKYPAIGLAEARDTAKTIRARATLGEDPQAEKVQARIGDALNHIADAYVERYARKNNKSWKQADALMRTYIRPKLGNRKGRQISRRDLRAIFDNLTESGKEVLANQVLAATSSVFSWAVEHEILEINPCRGIKRNKTKPSSRFLSNDELRAVWPLFDTLGLLPMTALKITLLSAQRPGEVCSMRWQDLDFEGGLWTLPGKPNEGWPGTKNGRDHEVPLTSAIVELLRELDPKETGHVFSSPKRGKCISIPRVVSIWAAAKINRFRPHDLRATAATGMDRLGIVRQRISLVLNHVEGGTTTNYVRHDMRQHKRDALEVWNKELMAVLAHKGKTDREAKIVQFEAAAN